MNKSKNKNNNNSSNSLVFDRWLQTKMAKLLASNGNACFLLNSRYIWHVCTRDSLYLRELIFLLGIDSTTWHGYKYFSTKILQKIIRTRIWTNGLTKLVSSCQGSNFLQWSASIDWQKYYLKTYNGSKWSSFERKMPLLLAFTLILWFQGDGKCFYVTTEK